MVLLNKKHGKPSFSIWVRKYYFQTHFFGFKNKKHYFLHQKVFPYNFLKASSVFLSVFCFFFISRGSYLSLYLNDCPFSWGFEANYFIWIKKSKNMLFNVAVFSMCQLLFSLIFVSKILDSKQEYSTHVPNFTLVWRNWHVYETDTNWEVY